MVGAGYWGPNLTRNFHTLGALATLCDLNPAVLSKLGSAYPEICTTTDFSEVLADPAIDAVILATPAPTHHRLAMQAMQAGKHVFVEKPLALSRKEAEALAAEADRLNRILMVGHILIYHPAVEALAALVRSGELGEVKHVRSERLSLGKLRSEENVLWSFGPHDASLLAELIATEPESVTASGHAILQEGIEDRVTMDLRYPGGVTAHIHLSWLEPVKRHRLTVIGTRKMAVFDDTLPEGKLRLYDCGFDRVASGWELRRGEETLVAYETGEPMARECAHFLECIQTGKRPRTDGRSGARVLGILEQAQNHLKQTHDAHTGVTA
jgi:UDP-2-acetamido-3-amino-2,3-dideoxy-glucuronate N-acetyltransferase